MAKKNAGAYPKYAPKNNGSQQATQKAAEKAAGPAYLGNNFGKDNLNPIARPKK